MLTIAVSSKPGAAHSEHRMAITSNRWFPLHTIPNCSLANFGRCFALDLIARTVKRLSGRMKWAVKPNSSLGWTAAVVP
jgi:hypothetical protein